MHHLSGQTKTAAENKTVQAGSRIIAVVIHQWYVSRSRSVMLVCTPSLAVFRTLYGQMDSNLVNLYATVRVGLFLEFLSLTRT